MNHKARFLSIIVVLFLAALSCNVPSGVTAVNQETVIAEKVLVQLTLTSIGGMVSALTTAPTSGQQNPDATQTFTPLATFTPLPTYTLLPTYTNLPPPPPPSTTVPTPCNWVSFVSDITYPDGTGVTVGNGFVKTWRLKNIGTCTWTSGYSLIFDHGDRMSAPDAVTLTGGTIPPGGTVDASVSLVAPGAPGTYQGYFRLKAPEGSIFGIGSSASTAFWAKIEAVPAGPPPPVGAPDLDVTSYTVNPNSIFAGDPVDVQINIKNKGTVNAGAFTVWWWSGEPTIAPQKIWDIPNLVAGGTIILNYNYVGYDFNIAGWDSNVVVDTGNTVVESNEGNNTAHQNVSVMFKLIPFPLPMPIPIPGP